ncbi:hypothetical protein ELQ88_33380 [Pseudomonas sp. MPC6]|nr:hypothetical protein ELQ88_33380 [Pseudomonas sp. MPC6]
MTPSLASQLLQGFALNTKFRHYALHVGAGLPAMVVNDNAGQLTPRGDLEFFASKLAPTLAWRPSTPQWR